MVDCLVSQPKAALNELLGRPVTGRCDVLKALAWTCVRMRSAMQRTPVRILKSLLGFAAKPKHDGWR